MQKSLTKDKDRCITALCKDLEEANDKGNNYEKNVSDSAITYSEVYTTVALHRVKVRRDNNNSVNLPQHSLCMCNQTHLH